MTVTLYALAVLLLITAAAGLLLLELFVPLFRRRKVGLNPGVGTETGEFAVRAAEGIPYLVEGGLPYPTHFDHTNRPRVSLCGQWSYRLDPRDEGEAAGWYKPSAWQQSAEVADDTAELPAVLNHSRSALVDYLGPAWFFRRFQLHSSQSEGSWQRLCLEGFLLRAAVWINGRFVTRREGGYTPLYADATPFLTEGENHICIRVDNRHTYTSLPPRLGGYHVPGWHTYLGIHRPIYLETLPDCSVVKAAARCRLGTGGGPGQLELDLLAHRRTGDGREVCRLQAELLGHDGARTASGEIELREGEELTAGGERQTGEERGAGGKVLAGRVAFTIESPQPWSPEHPALYTLRLTLTQGRGRDEVLLRTGFREIRAEREELHLNGRPLFLRGISKHEDHPGLGPVNSAELVKEDLDLISRLGANYIRLAHYPHDAGELTAARDRGLLLGEEIPYYQSGNGYANWFSDGRPLWEFPLRQMGLRQLLNTRLLRTAQRQLIEMVERDRNNPAVILWGVANESFSIGRSAALVYRWLRKAVRVFDDSRPITMAEFTTGKPLLDGLRRGCEHLEVLSVNLYLGWYYGRMEELEEHLSRLRRRFPEKPIILSEFGAGAAPGRSDVDGVYLAERVPSGKTYSEEYQQRLIEHYVRTAEQLPYVTGVSPWVFADFYCTEFPSNPIANFNIKGLVSRDREPKRAYFRLQELYTAIRNDGDSCVENGGRSEIREKRKERNRDGQ